MLASSLTQASRAIVDNFDYEQVFDTAFVGICFMRDRRFVRVNRYMEEFLGYGPGELVGQSVETVYARAEDFDAVGEVMERFPKGNSYVHERPLVTRAGEIRWCLISGRMLEPGNPVSASVWVVQDFSERRAYEDQLARARENLKEMVRRRTVRIRETNAALRSEIVRRRESEHALLESRERYRILFRNMTNGIVFTDKEGGIAQINPAMQSMLRAFTQADFRRIAARQMCMLETGKAPISLEALVRQLVAMPVEDLPAPLSLSLTLTSGETLWLEALTIRLKLHDLGAAIAFTNRTEQYRAREREAEQQRQLSQAGRVALAGQLAAAIAHELGQPLNACVSYAAGLGRLLQAEIPHRTDICEAVDRIETHLGQARDVMRNVRSFVSTHTPVEERVDLGALTSATLDLLRLPLRESGAAIEVKVGSAPVWIQGSRVELQQVLVNLILNALEAMRDAQVAEPRLVIHLRRPRDGRADLTIFNNGPEIPVGNAERIFLPYQTTKPSGLGLGLAISRTIVDSHGGRLWVDSTAKGGARFRFSVPTANRRGAG